MSRFLLYLSIPIALIMSTTNAATASTRSCFNAAKSNNFTLGGKYLGADFFYSYCECVNTTRGMKRDEKTTHCILKSKPLIN